MKSRQTSKLVNLIQCIYLVSPIIAVLMIQPQLASKQNDVHNLISVTYKVESFALILETKCRLFKLFRASDNVVPIQPGDTSNVEETSYLMTVFTLQKMFKSIARYVNAAINKTRDKVGIVYTLLRV